MIIKRSATTRFQALTTFISMRTTSLPQPRSLFNYTGWNRARQGRHWPPFCVYPTFAYLCHSDTLETVQFSQICCWIVAERNCINSHIIIYQHITKFTSHFASASSNAESFDALYFNYSLYLQSATFTLGIADATFTKPFINVCFSIHPLFNAFHCL